MKMPLYLGLAALVVAAGSVQAQEEDSAAVSPANELPENFTEVDRDGDGQLSIEEAQGVLQDVVIEDTNNDSQVNRSELEAAMPWLSLRERVESSEDYVIGEEEYGQLLQALHDRENQGANQASTEPEDGSDRDA